jgi:hypothetical protein
MTSPNDIVACHLQVNQKGIVIQFCFAQQGFKHLELIPICHVDALLQFSDQEMVSL